MRVPNPEQAIVDIIKLTDYCLNPGHPRGRHKARVFASALGITIEDADRLRDALLQAVANRDARLGDVDSYGQRYVVDFRLDGPQGPVPIRISWIIRTGDDAPRFTSCYVLRRT